MHGEAFETVNKAAIINSKGLNYIEFRDSLTPRYVIVWRDIFIGYFVLAIVLALAVYMQRIHPGYFILTISLGALLVGYTVSSLHLFIHEASHWHIASDRQRNDLLSNLFLGLLVGMDVEFYRSVHFAHHRLLGTRDDTEKSYFDAITWRYLIESITGIRVLKVITHRNKDIRLHRGEGAGPAIIKKNNRIFLAAALLNLLLIVSLFLIGYWQAALVWILGMGAAFPFFATFRQILEHRSVDASVNKNYNEVDHGIVHRMFGDGPIASTLGAAGFNRHLLHHWDPQVSYTRLKDVEEYLKDTPLSQEQQDCQTTYFKTFVALLNSH